MIVHIQRPLYLHRLYQILSFHLIQTLVMLEVQIAVVVQDLIKVVSK